MRNKAQGFSLVEMVIYISIFALLAVVVINSFAVVIGSFNETRTNRDLLESGNSALERISREIRLAQSIDAAGSTFAVTPGILDLNSTDASNNPRTVTFAVSNGALNLTQNGTLTGNLLNDNVDVTSLIFRQITTTEGSAVKVEMVLEDQRGKARKSATFYDTVILRGNY